MRSYDVAATSLVVDAPPKWTDNLLAHHTIDGVISARRGVARRIPRNALSQIALIRILNVEVGVGVADAVALAASILDSATGTVAIGGHLTLTFQRAALERQLDERLADVLESAPAPRRGRPPRHRRP